MEDIEVAPPKAHEVRIEIYYTGVCHTGMLSGKRTSTGQMLMKRQMHTPFLAKILRVPSPSSSGTKVLVLSNQLVRE